MPLHTKVGAGIFWNMSGVWPHQFQIRVAGERCSLEFANMNHKALRPGSRIVGGSGMPKEARRTVVVIYRSHPKHWFFAEVDGGCAYRFGPFESEKIVNDILHVIYPAGIPRETLTTMMDCDDDTLLRTAQGVACPPPPGAWPIEPAQMQSAFSAGASWRVLFIRRIQGWIQGWMAGGAISR